MSHCKHRRLGTGRTSIEEITVCLDCGLDLTVRTDPNLRRLIERVYSAPPENIAAASILSKIEAALR